MRQGASGLAHRLALAGMLLAMPLVAGPALAQQPAAPAAPPPGPSRWEGMARMQLERQYAGPLRDTVIQRWRDPADGTVCYLYLPISAPHSPPAPEGFVHYGANHVGSISCVTPIYVTQPAPPAARPPARTSRAGPTTPGVQPVPR